METPTDPFGSSDPFGFGSDPFALKSESTTGGGDQLNPFQTNSSSSNNNGTNTGAAAVATKQREEIVIPEPLPKVRVHIYCTCLSYAVCETHYKAW